MTRNEQLEQIRAACIKANPEIADKVYTHSNIEDGGRPIRLADVLLMVAHYAPLGKGDENDLLKELVFGRWNLRKDDLTEQSDECILFLSELLK